MGPLSHFSIKNALSSSHAKSEQFKPATNKVMQVKLGWYLLWKCVNPAEIFGDDTTISGSAYSQSISTHTQPKINSTFKLKLLRKT